MKSGRTAKGSSLEVFRARHPKAKTLIVGTGGIPLETFFSTSPEEWL